MRRKDREVTDIDGIEEILRQPFVAEGYASYELRTLQTGNKDNNYLL